MSNLLIGARNVASNAYVAVEKGLLIVAEKASFAMHEIYSIEGFEYLSKSLIADMKLLSLIPKLNGVFESCIKTFDYQKDLYYATKSISSITDFMAFKYDEARKQKRYYFSLPKIEDVWGHEGTDCVKILYAFGNFCDTGKFLQKNKIFSFSLCTHVANHVGSWKVFSSNLTLNDIPVIQTIFERPKDIFVFLASWGEVWRSFQQFRARGMASFKPEHYMKIASSFGKIFLITFGRNHYFKWWFIVIDVVTQNISLINFIYKKHIARQDRFLHPGGKDVAPAA